MSNAYLLSKACFPSTPENIYFGSMSVCLNIHNFAFVYIDHDFPKYDFSMLTSLIPTVFISDREPRFMCVCAYICAFFLSWLSLALSCPPNTSSKNINGV